MTLQPLPSGGSLETRPSLLQRLQSGDEKEQTSARQLGRSRTGWAEVVKAAGGLSYGSVAVVLALDAVIAEAKTFDAARQLELKPTGFASCPRG